MQITEDNDNIEAKENSVWAMLGIWLSKNLLLSLWDKKISLRFTPQVRALLLRDNFLCCKGVNIF